MKQRDMSRRPVTLRCVAVMVIVTLALAMLSMLSPSYAATQYTAPYQVTNAVENNGQASPKIAVDPNGKSHLVWYGPDPMAGGFPKIWYATNASGSWVTTQVSVSAYQQSEPDFAIDSNGKAHIVWMASTGNPWDVFYADNTSGAFVTMQLTHGASGQHSFYPTIALDPSGVSHVTWHGMPTAGGRYQIYYTFNPGGVFVSPVQLTNSATDQWGPQIAADAGGSAHITWIANDAGGIRQVWYMDNTAGSWPAPVQVSNATVLGGVSTLQIAADSRGKAHITWNAEDAAAVLQVYCASNASGAWSLAQLTHAPVGYDQWSPDMALGPDDSAHITWWGYADATGGAVTPAAVAVFYADNSSGSWSTVATLATYPGDSGGSATIAVDSRGRSHVAWTATLTLTDPAYQVFCADNNLGSWSTPIKITNATPYNDQDNPVIAVDPACNPHLTWDGNNPQTGVPQQIWYCSGTDPSPHVDSVSPSSGSAGTQVTVTGFNFGGAQGTSTVTVGGVKATVVSWSDAKIVLTVPQGATSGAVVVTTAAGGGSNNDKTFTVTNSTSWYLAEGTTAWGFSTYITIENPNNSAVTAKITYMNPNATSGKGKVLPPRQITLPPMSQTTVDPRWDLGDTDFSTRVDSLEGKPIAVDRTMFWTAQGAPSPEGHSSIGASAPSLKWFLPEGSTAWGFETWTLVENPNATDARVTLTYMVEGAGPMDLEKTIPAYSRATFSMADDMLALGKVNQSDVPDSLLASDAGVNSSVRVTSDIPVIAEQSMYRDNRREGSCSIGAVSASKTFYLSEGTTAWGFTSYVLLQNPRNKPANVTITYNTPDGPVAQPTFAMEPGTRKTIRVNDVLPDTDFSTMVQSDKAIVAERSMYWGEGTQMGEACHASIGLSDPYMTFYLPDGQTSSGHETYTLVQNPNPGAVRVRVTYLTQTGKDNVTFTDEIAAGSRKTYKMNDRIASGRASIMVESLDGARPIMAERSMYWNGRGAGTNTVGAGSN